MMKLRTMNKLKQLEKEVTESAEQSSRCYTIYIMAREAMQISGKQERIAVARLQEYKESNNV